MPKSGNITIIDTIQALAKHYKMPVLEMFYYAYCYPSHAQGEWRKKKQLQMRLALQQKQNRTKQKSFWD